MAFILRIFLGLSPLVLLTSAGLFSGASAVETAQPQIFFLQPAAGNQTLTADWSNITGLTQNFCVGTPSLVTVMGHIGLENMNTSDNKSNTMVATRLVSESGATIAGSYHTTNLNRQRHYEDMIVMAQYLVLSGNHSVSAQAYQRVFPNQPVTVVVKDPGYSGMFIKVEPYISPPTMAPPDTANVLSGSSHPPQYPGISQSGP